METISVLLCLFFIITFTKCNEVTTPNIKKPLLYFRRQVEELPDESTSERSEEDANIVAFLVQNVKEIFGVETTPTTLEKTRASNKTVITSQITNKTISTIKSNKTTTAPVTRTKQLTNVTSATRTTTANLTTAIVTTAIITTTNSVSVSTVNEKSKQTELFNLTKNIDVIEKKRRSRIKAKPEPKINFFIEPHFPNITENPPRRSCIVCNNVQLQECNDPKNKLVPSVICDHEEDLCYSQQTPFGLIDRGCFNGNLNLTTYVCSCNLCNYISISEMPYIFSKKKDWIENVIDLSRSKSFRTSIYKDMSCLSCEVNATTKTLDMLDNSLCLEGNIGLLPTKQCAEDEICGIKALRSDGYIWRGCLKSPLYNYWWSLCDSDLCNYDSVISLYDEN
ncbi:unnamed protein product [Parnassius apollo]|uniref:(apollo) hypothetical protein n=1 Tax=Parnassius apollo TaxID=110799 RepID=A0A8S3XIJ7_PARAO|nr:unnamed protein product [Parnassius apollo]